MTKQEFLERLRMSLNGKVSPGQVVENLQFYEDYINTEIRKGASEAEVMARLGDPRLLARTIVEARSGPDSDYAGGSQGGSGGAWYGEQEGTGGTWYESQDAEGAFYRTQTGDAGGTRYGEYQPYDPPGERHLRLLSKVPVWAWLLLVLVAVVLAVSAVFSLLAAILPVLLPILLVLFAVKAFRDWIH